MSKRRTKRFTRVDLILQAQDRVDQAQAQLLRMDNLDPRFAGCLNELRSALDARSAAEKEDNR